MPCHAVPCDAQVLLEVEEKLKAWVRPLLWQLRSAEDPNPKLTMGLWMQVVMGTAKPMFVGGTGGSTYCAQR